VAGAAGAGTAGDFVAEPSCRGTLEGCACPDACGVFPAAGAAAGAWAAGAFSRTELVGPDDIRERTRDVSMKTTAETVVIFDRKVEAPRAPNAVCDEPPKAAATSAPFPVWRRTTRIRKRQTKT